MHIKKQGFILFLFGLVLLISCAKKNTSKIIVFCEKKSHGEYLLKWEIYPEIDNASVDIFVSKNDTLFSSIPTHVVKSDDYISFINVPDSIGRTFFQLKVGDLVSDVVSNRFFEMDSIQNFRDVGGYYSENGGYLRWGKIFRSGNFSKITSQDREEIKNLHIKTVVDFRTSEVIRYFPCGIEDVNYVVLPMDVSGFDVISRKIQENRFMRGDAVIYTQDMYKYIIENSTEQIAEFFDILCDENNYPIVYNCFLGKDQSGLVTYFLLKALDVPTETIEDDYMASNIGINKERLFQKKDVHYLSESAQEALTLISHTDMAYLKYAISCIRKKRGSVEEYMLHDLQITPEKKDRLRRILLY